MNSSTHRRRSLSLGAPARVAFLVAFVLCSFYTVAVAQNTAPSTPNRISDKSGNACKRIAGCTACRKSGSLVVCTACKGDAILQEGACLCPAGYGLTGSARTVRASSASSTRASKVSGCSPCAAGSYSPIAKPVKSARCLVCPPETTFVQGSVTCVVPPGKYWDETRVEPCPVGYYCEGGPLTTAGGGPGKTKCPLNTSTAADGSSARSQCLVPAGYYQAGSDVLICPVQYYCEGGPYESSRALNQMLCPTGTTTPRSGSSVVTDCTRALPGYYNNGGSIQPCLVNTFCLGGPISGTTGPASSPCSTGTGTNGATGSDAAADCTHALSGYFNNGGSIEICPVNRYCPGGPISGTTGPVSSPCATGTGTNGATGSDAAADCTHALSGYFNNGGSIQICPAGFYCLGGVISGTSTPGATTCPGGTTSPQGSSSSSACAGCAGGKTKCSGVCTTLLDNANCGSCGNACLAGSTCTAYGLTRVPTCLCDGTQLPYYTPTTGTCGVAISSGGIGARTVSYSVTPNAPITLSYDSAMVPDRQVFLLCH